MHRGGWIIAWCAALLLAGGGARAASPEGAIELEVDARDVVRGIQHVRLDVPAAPGPLVLAYPRWIFNAAAGPITQLVELRLSAGGRPIPWRRDPRDAYRFELDVPARARTVRAEFSYLTPPRPFGNAWQRTPAVTPHLLSVLFETVVLYPASAAVGDLPVHARVRVPTGWAWDGALPARAASDGALDLPTVSLERLVDSPLIAGEHLRTTAVTEGEGAARLTVVADDPAALEVPVALRQQLAQLVAEATALFGGRPYRSYGWLVELGTTLVPDGVEHLESCSIRGAPSFFSDRAQSMAWGRLLSHEYVHAWNGKLRRPAGVATRTFQDPADTRLLWVYEGLTRYWGDLVLRGRSGLRSAAELREYVAWIAGSMAVTRPGRAWRPIADTAAAFSDFMDAPGEWTPIRRANDFYDEMLLVWLGADATIRRETAGRRSLDDLARAFFAAPPGGGEATPYERADVVAALSALSPRDWDGFLRDRVEAVAPAAPLEGLARAGWRLAWNDAPNEHLAARERAFATTDLSTSLGMWVGAGGEIADVVHGSPAFRAGIAPAMKVRSIGGRGWSADAARAAIVRAEGTKEPIELIVEHGDVVRVARVDHHGGLRYPHLERVSGAEDVLAAILAPRVARTAESGR